MHGCRHFSQIFLQNLINLQPEAALKLTIVGFWNNDIVSIVANDEQAQCLFIGSLLGLAYVAIDYCYTILLQAETIKPVRAGKALWQTQIYQGTIL